MQASGAQRQQLMNQSRPAAFATSPAAHGMQQVTSAEGGGRGGKRGAGAGLASLSVLLAAAPAPAVSCCAALRK